METLIFIYAAIPGAKITTAVVSVIKLFSKITGTKLCTSSYPLLTWCGIIC